jgi:ABC-type branched-subunit amino acid transport system ATPase component
MPGPILVAEIFKIIQNICQEGVMVLIVEQNTKQTLVVCDRDYVLENGRHVLSGTG